MRINLDSAVTLLNNGSVIGVPTETVYGLAASINHPAAIQQIYTLKGRPSNNPLIIHVAESKDVCSFMQENVYDLDLLARDFWPGPMTLVLPIKCKLIPSLARADLPTAAFRIPQHPLTLELLKKTGPLVMPSANLSGKPSSTSCEHVEDDFGIEFPVIDGGKCQKGLESTILIYHAGEWQIIRQGALAPEQFKTTLGYIPAVQTKTLEKPLCPGQMYRHYAPKAQLKLMETFDTVTNGVIIGFSQRVYPKECTVLILGSLEDAETTSSNLYATLRQLDQKGYSSAYVDMNFPKKGILATLAERLQRAAQT